MVSGKLGMMVCPMLEDEMIHNLLSDKDEKDVYLLDNTFTKTIVPKLDKNGIGFTLLNERNYLDNRIYIPDDRFSVIIWMMDLGLHEEPENLKNRIRELLVEFQDRTDSIMLYYGRCGKGLDGIEEWGREFLTVPVTIMKDRKGQVCDDCICVPVGGTENYLRLLRKYPGIMYFTPAMSCNFEEFMKRMELFKGVDKNDREMFRMILEMADYKYVMEIQTGLGDQENFHRCTEEFAGEYNLEIKQLEDGWVSLDVADLSYAEAKDKMKT
ncbi:MAG: DUF1638 domain-containing protein [Candidatus Methanomethylophilaceae archaeon]